MLRAVLLDSETLGEDIDFDGVSKLTKLTIFKTTNLEERLERCKDSQVIITNKVLLDRELLSECTELKLICITATGLNNVDLEYCKESNIQVKNVKGYSTDSVAQQTFNMALQLTSKASYFNKYTKKYQWQNSEVFTHLGQSITEISGKNWGVIGLGEIGTKVAKIAEAFGAKVFYHSASGKNMDREFPHLELHELLKTCHVVSIHAPLNEFTTDLIKKDEILLMKAGSVLLNLGRGGIINEDDLVSVFYDCDISIGLDVLTEEPITICSPINKILESDRFILSPHIAWASQEARRKLIALTIGNIRQFIKENP